MEVRFDHQYRGDLGTYEVVPQVDGVPLTELIDRFELAAGMKPAGDAYGGLVTRAFRFDATENHFHGQPANPTPVLACDCGDRGCWPLMAHITVTPTVVAWDAFGQPFRPTRDYTAFGPFEFARPQYDLALADLSRAIASEPT